MSYLALRFEIEAASAQCWADALLDAGAQSIDLSDPEAGAGSETPLYGEPGAEPDEVWPRTRLVALFAADVDVAAALARAAAATGCPAPPYRIVTLSYQDWVRSTQSQFTPIRVDDRLWIVPSWCEPVDTGAINLSLDPGLAFGTGSHPTTRLCLAWLTRELPPSARVLDYGCGSGILAIAAAKLGARRVAGVDLDPQALRASRQNARRNGVRATFRLPGRAAAQRPAWDVVLANILAQPLLHLAPVLAARLVPGGRLVLSGILARQADAVVQAYAPWFNIAVWRSEEGWDALAGIRLRTVVRESC